ncbi:hypothetical protein QBC39DRAFT_374779 [Podospora conica]|nr:hypothetical protein QBC39DRAFT_374779 [Schizothecium conicum]
MPPKVPNVQISLRSTYSTKDTQEATDDALRWYRCFELDEDNSSIILGRSSRTQSKGCVAAKDNGWYDSPVMSREHAEMMADFKTKSVGVRDLNSLHGTYFTTHGAGPEIKLRPGEIHNLFDGDELQFGVSVIRANTCFQPNSVKVGIKWSGEFPTKFQVPDGSDDGSSDIDDNFIDLTQPSDQDTSTHPHTPVAPRYVIDLSSSPPPSGIMDAEEEYDSDLECLETLPRRQAAGLLRQPCPVHTSDAEGELIQDDADMTDVDAASNASVRDPSEYDQEEDDDEPEETSSEPGDPIGWGDDEAYEDGEINEDSDINEDSESSMSDSQNDDESDVDFWCPRPEDYSPVRQVQNSSDMEDDMPAPLPIESPAVEPIVPQAIDSTSSNPFAMQFHQTSAAYTYTAMRASSVHALCNPPSHREFSNVYQAPPARIYVQKPSLVGESRTLLTPEFTETPFVTQPTLVTLPKLDQAGDYVQAQPLLPPKRTTMCISNVVANPADMAPKEAPVETSKAPVHEKRKADDISTLNPEEEHWAAGITKDVMAVTVISPAPSAPFESKVAESEDVPAIQSPDLETKTEVAESKYTPVEPSHILSEEDSSYSPVAKAGMETQRPAKRQRIRDIAERVGYAALGGVTAGAMIVGTLIYTAPTFA